MTQGRRNRRGQGGQTLIAFTIAFGLLLFGLTACVVDAAVLYVTSQRLASAAQVAATAGAGDIDRPAFRASRDVRLDTATFKDDCEAAGDSALTGATTTCTNPNNDGVTVRALSTLRVDLPIGLFGPSPVLTASYEAVPVVGTRCARGASCPPPP